ncbi:MAG: DUF3810 domain-containing protein [Lachnospiraceae bacterium]|nr:DUF3810 domain-containing protein [Lachnospiraceae bacterium]
MKSKRSIIIIRLLAGGLLLGISVLLILLSEWFPQMAEWHSVYVYKILVAVLGRFSGFFPFSLAELCVYGVVFGAIGTLIRAILRSLRERRPGAVMAKWFSGFFLTASVLIFLFVINCGINYRSVSFSEKSGFMTVEYTIENLKNVCIRLTEEVNERADLVARDEAGVMILEADEREDAVRAMEDLGKQYPALAGYYPNPKKVFGSFLLSYLGLSGIYAPFTVEANYNRDMTDYNKPFTACHELSHLRGFMQEEEANFIAFLACKDAGREDFQYSGYLLAWIYCMNELNRNDRAAWQEVRSTLDEKVNVDLRENSQFWAGYEGIMEEVSDKVNDTYLKANGQSDGVLSYDRMVNLVVSYYLE